MKLLRVLALPLALLAVSSVNSAAQTKIPVGVYEMVPDANYSAGFDVAGITVEFTDKTMTASMQGQVMVKSTFVFEGDVMTLTDVEGQVACPNPAKFKVTVSDKGVRFSPVEDPCAERGAVLAQVTMVKKG